MMSPLAEKRLLQITIALGCVIPLSAGLAGALLGARLLGGEGVNLNSHFRYLSGLLFAIGLGFLSVIPHIEHKAARMRLLTLMVFIGGVARLLGFLLAGIPSHSMFAAALMELVWTPLLCLWQHRVAGRITLQT